MEYGFVVLHYNAYNMTIECVDNLIEKFSGDNIHIVVVDNGSNINRGIEIIQKKYADLRNVDVLISNINLGFARGNNIGYSYLLENYSCDYIIIMNNDVIINQNDFLSKINELYKSHNFYVLGPDIYNPFSKKHQNPLRLTARTESEVRKRTAIFYRNYIFAPLYYLFSNMRDYAIRFFNIKSTKIEKNLLFRETRENVLLHGSCLIFSKDFLQKRKSCFNPITFLYHEEDILFYECERDDYKIVYSPEISVIHYEDISTNISYKNNYLKMKNMYKNMYDSSCILYSIIKAK